MHTKKKEKEKKGRKDDYERGVRQHCFQIYIGKCHNSLRINLNWQLIKSYPCKYTFFQSLKNNNSKKVFFFSFFGKKKNL